MNYYDKEELAKETKEILEYFFLEQPNDFFKTASRKQKKFGTRKSFEKLLVNKQKYVDRVWDENQTIVNYLLSHKCFRFTNTSLNELAKINQDWSSPNDSGENSLFFLMRKKQKISKIIEMITILEIDYHQKNINNHYFVNYFLKQEDIEEVLEQFEKGVNNFPEIRLNKYFSTYLDLLEKFPSLFKESIKIENEKFSKIKQRLYNYDFKSFNNNQIGIKLEDILENVEKHLNYFLLDNKLKDKNIKNTRLKI